MALYGHEISDTINVFEANLGRYAKLDKPGFMGKPALDAIARPPAAQPVSSSASR